MKTTQITIGGRIKFNIGPFEVEAIVINDNLGVIFHAYSPKQEPQKIEDSLSTDDHLPFSKDLNELWGQIKKDGELNNLMTDSNFRIVLKGLTIASTHFPVLYENKQSFFKGNKDRKVYLYDDKGKKKEHTLNDSNFPIPIGLNLPKSLMKDEKPNLTDYSLIPLRDLGSTGNYFPLNDWRFEIELDIEAVSTKTEEVVVLNPKYIKGKNDYVAAQLEAYTKENKNSLKWGFSEILDYAENDSKKKTQLKDFFIEEKMKRILLSEEKSKLKAKKIEVSKFVDESGKDEFVNLEKEIIDKIASKTIPEGHLKTAEAIYDFMKQKIEAKTKLNLADLKEHISNDLISLLSTYSEKYIRWQQIHKEKTKEADDVSKFVDESGKDEFDNLKKEIIDKFASMTIPEGHLKTTEAIYDFMKQKIEAKTELNLADLKEHISNDLINRLSTYTEKYTRWQQIHKDNPDVSKFVDEFGKNEFDNLKQEIGNYIKEKTFPDGHLKTADEIHKYIKDKIVTKTTYQHEDLKKFISTAFIHLLMNYNSKYDTWQQTHAKKVSEVPKFEDEFVALKEEIKNIITNMTFFEGKLKTVGEIYEFMKQKIEAKTAYDFEELSKNISNDLKNLLFTYKYKYSQWEQNRETKASQEANDEVNKLPIDEMLTKKIAGSFKKGTEIQLTITDKVEDWINSNQECLNKNSDKPTLKGKDFKKVDDLYLLAMSPKERAAYDFEYYNNINDKYITVNTNKIKNLFGFDSFEVKELQFKFKRTLSEQLRTKLSEIYNNTDVFQSKIVAKEKELEDNEKLLAATEENIAKTEAEIKVGYSRIASITDNNSYYENLVDENKAVVDEIYESFKEISAEYKGVFKDLDITKLRSKKSDYLDMLTQIIAILGKPIAGTEKKPDETPQDKTNREKVEMEMKVKKEGFISKVRLLALGIEKYVSFEDDVSIKEGKLSITNLKDEFNALTEKKESLDAKKIKLNGDKEKLEADKKSETEKDENSKLIVKLSEHPRLALHPDWYDKEAKKLKFPTLQDRVMTALKEFGK